MESKKQLILLILNELNANSDENHPLTQTAIAKKMLAGEFSAGDEVFVGVKDNALSVEKRKDQKVVAEK